MRSSLIELFEGEPRGENEIRLLAGMGRGDRAGQEGEAWLHQVEELWFWLWFWLGMDQNLWWKEEGRRRERQYKYKVWILFNARCCQINSPTQPMVASSFNWRKKVWKKVTDRWCRSILQGHNSFILQHGHYLLIYMMSSRTGGRNTFKA